MLNILKFQVDRLEVVNKRFVRVTFTPGKTPVDGVSGFIICFEIAVHKGFRFKAEANIPSHVAATYPGRASCCDLH